MTPLLLLQTEPGVAIAVFFVAGLVIGSFLNVVIHRLPLMLEREWRAQCAELAGEPVPDESPLDLVRPRSRCPGCGAPIKAVHNVPVLSWLWLRGRCAACSARISARYPLVELAAGALAAVVVWQLGFGWAAVLGAILAWTLLALACIDFDTHLLPDALTLPLLWLGLLANLHGTFARLPNAVLGATAGYLLLWAVYHGFRLLTGKEGMGYGDFKLLAAIGAWLGWQALPLVIILSSLVGAVVGVALIAAAGRDRSVPIPFGPYLAAAGFIACLWGDALTGAYLRWALPA